MDAEAAGAHAGAGDPPNPDAEDAVTERADGHGTGEMDSMTRTVDTCVTAGNCPLAGTIPAGYQKINEVLEDIESKEVWGWW